MKAVVIEEVGTPDVLKIHDIDKPVATADQVLIEVHASSVNPIDTKIRNGSMSFRFGKDFPMVMSFDASGVVSETGPGVNRFKPGDEVFVRSDLLTGCACAEYLAVSESIVTLKPEQMSHQQAAAMPLAGLTALQGLRDECQLQAGQRVLIIAASGGVGTYAVQIAKAIGADVTAVCSGPNIDLVKELGADRAIDYTCEDVFATEEPYDAIYDLMGVQRFRNGCKALTMNGHFTAAVPTPGVIFGMFVGNKLRRQKAHFVMCKSSGADLEVLANWVREGRLRSVIDSTYSMDEIAQAHRRIETKRSCGKLVIKIKD